MALFLKNCREHETYLVRVVFQSREHGLKNKWGESDDKNGQGRERTPNSCSCSYRDISHQCRIEAHAPEPANKRTCPPGCMVWLELHQRNRQTGAFWTKETGWDSIFVQTKQCQPSPFQHPFGHEVKLTQSSQLWVTLPGFHTGRGT